MRSLFSSISPIVSQIECEKTCLSHTQKKLRENFKTTSHGINLTKINNKLSTCMYLNYTMKEKKTRFNEIQNSQIGFLNNLNFCFDPFVTYKLHLQ